MTPLERQLSCSRNPEDWQVLADFYADQSDLNHEIEWRWRATVGVRVWEELVRIGRRLPDVNPYTPGQTQFGLTAGHVSSLEFTTCFGWGVTLRLLVSKNEMQITARVEVDSLGEEGEERTAAVSKIDNLKLRMVVDPRPVATAGERDLIWRQFKKVVDTVMVAIEAAEG